MSTAFLATVIQQAVWLHENASDVNADIKYTDNGYIVHSMTGGFSGTPQIDAVWYNFGTLATGQNLQIDLTNLTYLSTPQVSGNFSSVKALLVENTTTKAPLLNIDYIPPTGTGIERGTIFTYVGNTGNQTFRINHNLPLGTWVNSGTMPTGTNILLYNTSFSVVGYMTSRFSNGVSGLWTNYSGIIPTGTVVAGTSWWQITGTSGNNYPNNGISYANLLLFPSGANGMTNVLPEQGVLVPPSSFYCFTNPTGWNVDLTTSHNVFLYDSGNQGASYRISLVGTAS